MDYERTRRQLITTGVAIGVGTLATRLERLERMAPRPRDGDAGDALVIVVDDLDGGPPEVRGRIGEDTLVVHLSYRLDGPQ